jgi:hypothetical protein
MTRAAARAITPGNTKFVTRALLVALTMGAGSALAQTAPPPPVAASPASAGALEAKLDQVVKEYAKDPQFKGHTEQQVRDRIEFVAGNVIFATVHEIGHMLVAEMGIPVLGKEEDAVDAFAVLTGLKLGSDFSDRILTQSARGWFLSDRRNQKQKIKMVFYDEHGLDRQRAYNIVCLMVGGNPEKFGKVAEMTKMPEERQGTCQGDYSNASWSWNKVLEPHIRKPDQPKASIPVVYNDTKKYAVYEKGFREIRLLEILSEHLSDRYVWRGPVGMVMEECGEPGARWDLSDRKIHVCYELAADFGMMYRDYGKEPTAKAQKTAGKKHKR